MLSKNNYLMTIQELFKQFRDNLQDEIDLLQANITQRIGQAIEFPKPTQKIKIYVDAGHGGNHPSTGAYMTNPRDGKRYIFVDAAGKELLDIREGVINRLIANEFCNLLQKEGFAFQKLYHDYLDRSNTERCLIANQDYQIQKVKGVKCILLSFHSNANGMIMKGIGDSAKGWSVWTTRGNTESDRFASIWFEKTKAMVGNQITYREDRSDGDADWEADFDILFHSLMPAVLVENLFFTNYQDALILNSAEYQKKSAQVALEAVKTFFN
jgi:N-acetylmuramoyl-L-alanine amidase